MGGELFIHIIADPEGGRTFYISIEPRLSAGLDEAELVRQIDRRLLDYAMDFEGADTPQQQTEVWETILEKICMEQPTDESGLRSMLHRLIGKSKAVLWR